MTDPIEYPYDVGAVIADIKTSLEAMEEHNDRSPYMELWHILRDHDVPPQATPLGWKWNATPECAALRDRWRECQRRYRERIQGMILAGMRQVDIVEALQLTSNRIVTQHKRQLGVPVAKRHNWDDKHDIIRRLFARGYTVPEVAKHFSVTVACMRTAIDRAGISVPRCQSRADVAARNIVRAKRGLPPLKPLVERIAEGKRRKHEVG